MITSSCSNQYVNLCLNADLGRKKRTSLNSFRWDTFTEYINWAKARAFNYIERLNALAFAQFIYSARVSHRNKLMCQEQDLHLVFFCLFFFGGGWEAS